MNLRSGNSYQFRDNGDLIAGECARFNFNPFNYYRIPNERYNALVIGSFEFSDRFEAYSTIEYSNITVDAQVAPSGTFGAQFDVPMARLALGWVLGRPGVTSVLIGGRQPRHVDQAFEAAEAALPSELEEALDRL